MAGFMLETRIDAPARECFALSLSIDAHTGSMARSGERAVAGVTTGEIGPGESVTWRARHFGIRFRMTSAITAYDPPRRFVDEQLSGPFRRWWHEHEFVEDGAGTRMIDRIEFEAPFGPLGRIAERLLLVRYMERLIVQRNDWLAHRLESGRGPAVDRNDRP
ncbi:SRPBCC family protein [Leucobacter allii]|uniref:SRPBCC family protein n=1 Tax=Leucobacter allii TaxID=2932247 RepID=A0ABY4FJM9_9MICO|nr:SRPBCC family protein [Leucobacter allii]UOQ56217.1 SRPBCC family protein [Leucobacter allii]UOR00684.1 SRPBCC family protein [Leucobacter allii]